jgi:leader peptidase (prepilin peptidase) / N-methyltransferase
VEISQLPSWYVNTIAFIFGAFWGSFANVCIARIPEGLSIVWPPSRCPKCLNAIRPWDNIPLISWALLGAKCRDCRAPISARYPLVELLTALLSVALVLRCTDVKAYLVYFPLVLMLVVLTFIDLDHWLLPDVITFPGIAAGIGFSILKPITPAGIQVDPTAAVVGVLLGGGVLYLVALLFRLATGKMGMGGGDIKLMGMVGAFLGYHSIFPIIFLSALQGSVVGIALLLIRKKDSGPHARDESAGNREDDFVPTRSHIPYGPFISLAALEYLFFGPLVFDGLRFFTTIS